MILEDLRVINFRSYKDKLISPDKKLTEIVGPNGIGKTNLLEAITILCRGSSFRIKKDIGLIKNGSTWARIEANFDLDGKKEKRVVKLTCPTSASGLSAIKKLEIDGVNRSLSKHTLPVVIFEPDQMKMIGGGPGARRDYLDERISFLDFSYAKNLSDYKRVVQHRNRLLKQIQKGSAKKEDLFIWHVKISELSVPIIEARESYLETLNEKLQTDYRKISKSQDIIEVEYLPSFYRMNKKEISSALFRKLEEDTDIDIKVAYTRRGPHRDDWTIQLNGHEASSQASRGEIRTLLLSIKLFEFEHLQDKYRITPLVLLDDVMSELDENRRKELLSFFIGAQVIMSGVE